METRAGFKDDVEGIFALLHLLSFFIKARLTCSIFLRVSLLVRMVLESLFCLGILIIDKFPLLVEKDCEVRIYMGKKEV